MVKQKLIRALEERTPRFDAENPGAEFTSEALSSEFAVKRNTVSHYLNQAVEAGILLKINTRPVYFLHREAFQRQFHPVEGAVFKTPAELAAPAGPRDDTPAPDARRPVLEAFGEVIGHDGSLRKAIEQIVAAISYPDNSLPIMLHGPTGVGKSYLAGLVYRFARDNAILRADAPFLSFNCAQYANNPELLSSHLFGYVKGAFTGAAATTPGLLEKADGGILFLDEVHRLSWEGQEKLFTFMDQGVLRRMGENAGWHRASVRLIMATTEDLYSSFLDTFLRRIPVCVPIPSLEERGREEKLRFIRHGFLRESRVLGRRLRVSGIAQGLLLARVYTGNLGELENVIRYMTAAAFARCGGAPTVEIGLQDLPEPVIGGAAPDRDAEEPIPVLEVDPRTRLEALDAQRQTRDQDRVGDLLRRIADGWERGERWSDAMERRVGREVGEALDYLNFSLSRERHSALGRYVGKQVEEVFAGLAHSHGLRFNAGCVQAVAGYVLLRKRGALQAGDRARLHPALEELAARCAREHRIACQLLRLLEGRLEFTGAVEDELLLTLYIKHNQFQLEAGRVRALIVAHGYATASSIAHTANRMLEETLFEAVDIPMQTGRGEVLERVSRFVSEYDASAGLVLLVDMESMLDLDRPLRPHLTGPVAILSGVSTQMAVRIGALLLRDGPAPSLEELAEQAQRDSGVRYKVVYPRTGRQKVVLTCCVTGMGTAQKIKEILDASLPGQLAIRVIASDYKHLKKHGRKDPLFQLYQVLGVVGTVNPRVAGVEYISVEDLMSGQVGERLAQVLGFEDPELARRVNDNLVRNFSLDRLIDALSILDTNKIIAHVERCIHGYEELSGRALSNTRKMGVFFHVSCMVERLIRSAPVSGYPDFEAFQAENAAEIDRIQRAFHPLESIYHVEIPPQEIGYIHDILHGE